MTSIFDPVSDLPGVGPKRAQALAQLKIFNIHDLMSHFPFRYDDIEVKAIEEIDSEAKVSLKGEVVTPAVVQFYGSKKSRLTFRLKIQNAIIQVVFFNQHYLKDRIQLNEELVIHGKYDPNRQQLNGFKILSNQGPKEKFQAIYPANQQIKQNQILNLVQAAFEMFGNQVPEVIPQHLIEKYQLMPYSQALYAMHFPENQQVAAQAKRTISFQELLHYQLRMQEMAKSKRKENLDLAINYDNSLLKEWIGQALPFELTNGQKQVVNEICADLRRPFSMNRLLQGDVGSGKTAVAAVAIAATLLGGFQAALMVPTEILAEQHYQGLKDYFLPFNFKVALLTGSTTAKEKRTIYQALEEGTINLVIGTHALIQEPVKFKALGLAITDEQHRFGVNQRQALKEKGPNGTTNVLFMTATPIPRTLAISLYGDMQVSLLKELPAGRKPIKTLWTKDSEQDQVYSLIESEVEKGRQIYIICPLISESESVDLKNTEAIYQQYYEHFQGKLKMGLLHGQMLADDKDDVMVDFKNHNYDLIVSTTVIEVGLNVPNASVMVIHDAERFGLAQLHQLRGRVGRGKHASYCILLADPKTDEGRQRMEIMTQSQDGFFLAEKDMELRGSGDLFGSRQSGLPEFRYADLVRDQDILVVAMNEAVASVHDETWYNSQENQMIKDFLEKEKPNL